MNIEIDIKNQIKKAESKFSEYNSIHEGYGIIKEEFDELWDEIKKKEPNQLKMYTEASHVACTAIRFMKMIKQNYKGVLP